MQKLNEQVNQEKTVKLEETEIPTRAEPKYIILAFLILIAIFVGGYFLVPDIDTTEEVIEQEEIISQVETKPSTHTYHPSTYSSHKSAEDTLKDVWDDPGLSLKDKEQLTDIYSDLKAIEALRNGY